MPKLNVYVSETLAERIRAADIAVSAICQQALEDEARRIEAQRNADEAVRKMAERFQSAELLTDPDEVSQEADGHAAGTHWATHIASSHELAELVEMRMHGDDEIAVDRGQEGLFAILTDAGLRSDSETNRVLSTSDPWGRGFLRACNELWQRVQPLM